VGIDWQSVADPSSEVVACLLLPGVEILCLQTLPPWHMQTL